MLRPEVVGPNVDRQFAAKPLVFAIVFPWKIGAFTSQLCCDSDHVSRGDRSLPFTKTIMKPKTLPAILFLIRTALASPYLGRVRSQVGDDEAEPGSPEFWSKLLISTALVLAGGVFAGYVYFWRYEWR